jgi:GAF domain-containing protein
MAMEKKEKVKVYEKLIEEIRETVQESDNREKFLDATATLLKERLSYSTWVGFYYPDGKELRLGPYEGPPACESIPLAQGICGKAAVEEEIMVVPDVQVFQGAMATNPRSRSEIVVPIFNREGDLVTLLDLDSTEKGAFDRTDRRYLEELANILKDKI